MEKKEYSLAELGCGLTQISQGSSQGKVQGSTSC